MGKKPDHKGEKHRTFFCDPQRGSKERQNRSQVGETNDFLLGDSLEIYGNIYIYGNILENMGNIW